MEYLKREGVGIGMDICHLKKSTKIYIWFMNIHLVNKESEVCPDIFHHFTRLLIKTKSISSHHLSVITQTTHFISIVK